MNEDCRSQLRGGGRVGDSVRGWDTGTIRVDFVCFAKQLLY